jgi:hypothetical protein
MSERAKSTRNDELKSLRFKAAAEKEKTKEQLNNLAIQGKIDITAAAIDNETANRELALLDLQAKNEADLAREEIKGANQLIRKGENAAQKISSNDMHRTISDDAMAAGTSAIIGISKTTNNVTAELTQLSKVGTDRMKNAATNLELYRAGAQPAIEEHEMDLKGIASQKTIRSVDKTSAKLALKAQILQDRADFEELNGSYAENRRKERQEYAKLIKIERELARQAEEIQKDERDLTYDMNSTFINSYGVAITPMRPEAYTTHNIPIKSEYKPGNIKGDHKMPGIKGEFFLTSHANINKMKEKSKLLEGLNNEINEIQRTIGVGSNDTSILGTPENFSNSVFSTASNILNLENKMTKREIVADLIMGSESSFQTFMQTFITSNSVGLEPDVIEGFKNSFDTEFDAGSIEFFTNFIKIINDDLNGTKGLGSFSKIIKGYTPSYNPQSMNSLSKFDYNQLTIIPPIPNINILNAKTTNLTTKIKSFNEEHKWSLKNRGLDDTKLMHPKIDITLDILEQVFSIIEKTQLKTIMEFRANGNFYDQNIDRIKEIDIDRIDLQTYHALINFKGDENGKGRVSYDYKGNLSNAIVWATAGHEDLENIMRFREVHSKSDYVEKNNLRIALSKLDAATVDLYKEHSAAIKDVLANCKV